MSASLAKGQVKQVFDDFAEENGNLKPGNLCKVLRKLGLPADARSLVQVQGSLRYLNNSDVVLHEEGDGIDFALFWRWYKLETHPGVYEHNNELLVRRVIEHPKLPTRNLKQGNYVYGKKNVPDKESAGEVLLKWVVGERSKSKEAGVSLLKVNKEAVRQKHTTPKQLNLFLKEHINDKNLQRPKIVGRKKNQRKQLERAKNRDMARIEQAKPIKPREEDFNSILYPARVDEKLGARERPYVDTSGQRVKGKLPFPRQTKCSMLQRNFAAQQKQNSVSGTPDAEPLWKMKKFLKVPNKTVIPKVP